MPVMLAGTFVVALVLAVTALAYLWFGLGTVDREWLPRLAPEDDVSWIPSAGWVVAWGLLGACVLVVFRSDRKSRDRIEPWAVAGAYLGAAGIATAWRALPVGFRPPAWLQRSSSMDLALALSALAMLAATVGLLRIARHRGAHRGAVLASGALLIPPASMWWVVVFVVAPEYTQPRADAVPMELARVPAPVYLPDPEEWAPVLEMYVDAGDVRIHARESGRESEPWESYLRDGARRMQQAPVGTDLTNMVPDEPVRLRAQTDLPVEHVLDVVDACRAAGIWKVLFATRKGDGSMEGSLLMFLPREGQQVSAGARIEVRAPRMPGARWTLRCGDLETDDLRALFDTGLFQESIVVRVATEPELPWAAIAEIFAALAERRCDWVLERLEE